MKMVDLNGLKPGETIDNDQLREIFKCSPQGGMRRSLTTNTLVIVSNHVTSIYDDRWVGGIFHYTGMGQVGDQFLDSAQNKTLAESNTNSVGVFLFEVFTDKEYTFIGQVVLSGAPYYESQPDAKGNTRRACMFPLTVLGGEVPIIESEKAQSPLKQKERKARRLTDAEVEERAARGRRQSGSREISSQQYDRDPWVAECTKRRANGICQLCNDSAPFNKSDGEPYLETHHVVWLARGGEDTIEDAVNYSV
jgi:5-methylcytosine-specific restriction protein A